MLRLASMNFDNSRYVTEETSNENHISDINHATRYTRWFLTVIGIWPRLVSNATTIERHLSKLLSLLCLLFLVTLVMHVMLHCIVRDLDSSQIVAIIGPLSFQCTCAIKHVVLFFGSDSVKMCISHMKTDWRRLDNDNDRGIMTKNLKVGDNITIASAVVLYAGVFFFNIVTPLWRGKSIDEFNETVKPLPYPGLDLILDPRVGYNYEIIICTLWIATFFRCSVVAGTFNLVTMFVTHACGQLKLITPRLGNLLSSDGEEDVDHVVATRVAFIIRSHARVLKFSSQVDEALRVICLLEVVDATVLISWTEYQCMMRWSKSDNIAIITFVTLVISFSFNVYMYCYVGELLTDQCHQVGRAAYNSDWFKQSGKAGVVVSMVIAVANCPPKLTAGNMFDLSIRTFGTIMRTSFGYLNIMRTVTE